jgi:Holliday junction resolvasome RuvABC endonuclease subunit
MKQCYNKLLAIDPSLRSSGWALFSVSTQTLLAVGKLCALGTEHTLAHRVSKLQEEISQLFLDLDLGLGDLLVLESATTIRDPSATLKVEQVRTIFETLARSRGVEVPGRLNPRSVQYEVLGLKGKQLKREIVKSTALQVALHLFTKDFNRLNLNSNLLNKEQDIVDALLIGSLALIRIDRACKANQNLADYFNDQIKQTKKRWSAQQLAGRVVMRGFAINLLFVFLFLNIFILAFSENLTAQSRTNDLLVNQDPRGPNELVICSQNLNNYGAYNFIKDRSELTPELYSEKQRSLLNRFLLKKCDVIAVQEILSLDLEQANEVMKYLADILRFKTNRFFEYLVVDSNDERRRLGYLIAKDRATVLNKVSYAKVELPKIEKKQRQRYFSRGPFEVQLKVRGREAALDKVVTLINFHFKSKSTSGGTDPSGLEFEPFRLEMSEALRKIVELRHGEAVKFGKEVLVLLGDRNSNFDAASANILEGVLHLRDFQDKAPCRLSARGMALCQAGIAKPPKMRSVLTTDPETKLFHGTHKYKKIYSWLDDIILPVESLPFAWQTAYSEGDYASGVVSQWPVASDHNMVWVELNW